MAKFTKVNEELLAEQIEDPDALLNVNVLETVVGGESVYKKA